MTLPYSEPDNQQLANGRSRRYYEAPAPWVSEEHVVAEVWRMLRKRKLLIVGWVLASALLAVLYIVLRSPSYEASARIQVSPVGTNSLGLANKP